MKGGGKVFDAENSCWHRDDCAKRNVNAMRKISILHELFEISPDEKCSLLLRQNS